ENPHSQVVLDDKSAVKNAWGLNPKDSAIIVLDKTGKVKFVKEGKLSDSDIQTVISLVNGLTK
ncbi:YtfJ family protein, partial [Haemophilus influenzae]